MPDQPINVVGAGFVPGVAGMYGNNTIPVEQKEDAPVLVAPDAPMLSSSPLEQIQPPSKESAQEAQPSASPSSESNSDE